jgi:hypothetical protein
MAFRAFASAKSIIVFAKSSGPVIIAECPCPVISHFAHSETRPTTVSAPWREATSGSLSPSTPAPERAQLSRFPLPAAPPKASSHAAPPPQHRTDAPIRVRLHLRNLRFRHPHRFPHRNANHFVVIPCVEQTFVLCRALQVQAARALRQSRTPVHTTSGSADFQHALPPSTPVSRLLSDPQDEPVHLCHAVLREYLQPLAPLSREGNRRSRPVRGDQTCTP